MNDLVALFWVFTFLFIFLTIVAVVGHLIWLSVAWIIKNVFGRREETAVTGLSPNWEKCLKCGELVRVEYDKCVRCGTPKPSEQTRELKKELEAAWRQLHSLQRKGAIDDETFQKMKVALETERDRVLGKAKPKEEPAPIVKETPIEVLKETQTAQRLEPITTFKQEEKPVEVIESIEPIVVEKPPHVWASTEAEEDKRTKPFPRPAPRPIPQPTPQPIPQQPSRSWTEIVEAFMQERNIKWGEIIGGLLVIGSSTALVISLWQTISQIPVLKFLIFTFVTVSTFLIGLYTEHRWKLTTTSRGILTIATLLVPLNFLAIAAVSSGQTSNLLVLVSEVFAPVIFLVCVYFAGKTLTPNWAQVLAIGVLGSSVGQILIHHFSSSDMGQGRVLGLGIVTTVCFVASIAWMLFKANTNNELNEETSNAIFITLGTSVFATLLPLGLLLYKSPSAADSLMWVSPLIGLCAAPVLACGAFLWRRIEDKNLAYSRLAGTSMAIIGALIVVVSIFIAFPNPTSVVLTSLISFYVFTAVAILLNLPIAHAVALFSFTLAYTVASQILIGKVDFQMPRSASLLSQLDWARAAQLFAPLFLLYFVVSELLRSKTRDSEGKSYFIASLVIAVIAIPLLAYYGFASSGDFYYVAPIYALFAAGIFVFAWTRKIEALTWVASFIFILSLTQGFGFWYGAPFAWQTACLIYSSIATIFALIFWQRGEEEYRIFANPLRWVALISSSLVAIALIQSRPWQSTAMITSKLFWLSLIWFGLLWLIRSRWLFAATQAALMCACSLTTKLILQNFDWYDFKPLVYLHPTALHIYGSVILLLCIAWTTVRILMKQRSSTVYPPVGAGDTYSSDSSTNIEENQPNDWSNDWIASVSLAVSAERGKNIGLLQSLSSFLNAQQFTFDRLAALFVFAAFTFLTLYAAFHGVAQELSLKGEKIVLPDIAGYSHAFAYGFSAWVVFALLLVTMISLLKEKARYLYLFIAIITLSLLCPLIASNWENQIAVASAWRWCAAVFLVIAFVAMQKREAILNAAGLPIDEDHKSFLSLTEKFPTLLSVIPIIILTIIPLLLIAQNYALQNLSSGFFNSIGQVLSYTLPLAVIVVVGCVHSVKNKNSVTALLAGLTAMFAVVTAHLFLVYSTNNFMNRTVTAQVFQLIAISTSAFSILWLATRKLWGDGDNKSRYSLGSLISLGAIANLILITFVAFRLFLKPGLIGIGTLEVGSIRGWLGLILCLIAVAWFLKAFEIRIKAIILFVALSCIGAMITFTLSHWDNRINWRGYHVLLIATMATALLMWLTNFLKRETQTDSDEAIASFPSYEDYWNYKTAFFSSLAILCVVVMVFRSLSPMTTHWWFVVPLMIVSALALCLFTTTFNRLFIYASSGLLCLAASVWFSFSWDSNFDDDYFFSGAYSFFNANFLAISLIGIASFFLEKHLHGLIPEKSLREIIPPFNKLAFIAVFSFLALLFIGGIGSDINNQRQLSPNAYLFAAMLFTFGVLAFTSLWDVTSKFSRLIVYLYCLLAALLILDRFNVQPKQVVWIGLVILGVYALITSILWWQRESVNQTISNLKIVTNEFENLIWLRPFNFALVIVSSILAAIVVIYFDELHLRLLASIIVIAQLFTLGLLRQGERKQIWQRIALIVFSFGLSLFGCAWLQPEPDGTWMNRSVVLMIVMFVLLSAFGLLKTKLADGFEDWLESAKRVAPLWIVVSALSLLFVLITEVSQQIQYGEVKTQTPALIVVVITLISGAIACVVFAADADKDPLSLTEKGRMNYVYVAEVLIVLLFMHIRLSRPEWFSGFFEKYWAIFVVVLAYLGIGLSEFLRRQNLTTLSKPIERTGIFLPLLPVLGFWIINSQSQANYYRVDYSVVLFAIGVLYGALSVMRRSFGFGLLAALAGNGGLWYALHRTDSFGVLQHPQLWFIPFAVSVLIAGHLNRDRFSEEQTAGIRYISLMMIYVSSTADIFLNGVSNAPWLPVVLMFLSVAGVFCGIMFRVRAFLFLGFIFLVISLITMIYYAHVDLQWTWLRWVVGILLGGAIIFTFAIFEKKKQEMMRVLEDVRGWEK
jgi:hypothetical protein